MKRITQIGMLASAMLLCMAGNPVPVLAVGEEQKNLIISEVSPEGTDSASKEYITIHNPNPAEIDVSGWIVQYRSASYKPDDTKGWSIRAILGCQSTKLSDCASPSKVVIDAYGTLKLSSYETGEGIVPLASGMATSGGVVRLMQPGEEQTIHDKVGYGAAADYEGTAPAPAPKAGQEVLRKKDDDGKYIDTDNNGADFALLVVEEEEESEPTTSNEEQPGQGAGLDVYFDVEISELFPDPASPQTDSDDEFVELYNPHAETIDMNGYVIVTGANWTHKYTIRDVILAPYGYVALSSAQTNVALSNSGTGLRLYDPSGRLLFEVPNYGKAQSGNSWVRDASGKWVWTTKPSPDAQNIVELPVIAAKPASSATKKSTSKAASSKKSSTPKTSAVKGVSTPMTQSAQTQAQGGNQTGMWVLAVAAVLGLGYAVFEYRQEIGGFVRRRWEGLMSMGRK